MNCNLCINAIFSPPQITGLCSVHRQQKHHINTLIVNGRDDKISLSFLINFCDKNKGLKETSKFGEPCNKRGPVQTWKRS